MNAKPYQPTTYGDKFLECGSCSWIYGASNKLASGELAAEACCSKTCQCGALEYKQDQYIHQCFYCNMPKCQCKCCAKCGKGICECCEHCGNNCSCCCTCKIPCPTCGKQQWEGMWYEDSCLACGYTQVENLSHQQVIEKYGIKFDRCLGQECADFYVLEDLWNNHRYPPAYFKLNQYCEEVAPEFATYLDLACGGELRYATAEDLKAVGFKTIAPIHRPSRDNHKGSRHLKWMEWAQWKTPKERAEYAVEVFNYGAKKNENGEKAKTQKSFAVWEGSGVGGPKWGDIAEVYAMWARKELTAVAFIDRVWNLQHNGGCALNKAYGDVDNLTRVLALHGDPNSFIDLLRKCSNRVQVMYEECQKWIAGTLDETRKTELNKDALLLVGELHKARAMGMVNLSYKEAIAKEKAYLLRERQALDKRYTMLRRSNKWSPEQLAGFKAEYDKLVYLIDTFGGKPKVKEKPIPSWFPQSAAELERRNKIVGIRMKKDLDEDFERYLNED